MRRATGLLALAAALLASGPSVPAQAPSMTVFSSNAITAPLRMLAAAFRQQHGVEIVIDFDTSPSISRRLAAGERPDVLIGATSTVEQAVKAGTTLADSRVAIGRMGVGVAISRGARRPDLATVDGLKASLLRADAVLYSQGASGVYMERLLRELGLAGQLGARAVQLPTGAAMLERLAGNRPNEIGFTMASEIMEFEARGVTLVGLLPAAVQNYTSFDAVVMSGARAPDPARAFVRSLTTADARTVLAANGWQF